MDFYVKNPTTENRKYYAFRLTEADLAAAKVLTAAYEFPSIAELLRGLIREYSDKAEAVTPIDLTAPARGVPWCFSLSSSELEALRGVALDMNKAQFLNSQNPVYYSTAAALRSLIQTEYGKLMKGAGND